jgi:hypothetical protein
MTTKNRNANISQSNGPKQNGRIVSQQFPPVNGSTESQQMQQALGVTKKMPGNSNQISKHSRTFTDNNMIGNQELTHSIDETQNSKHAMMSQSNNSLPKKGVQ